MTNKQQDVLDQLRREGYAVCVFTPEELAGAAPIKVEDRLCEEGWTIIECLK